MSSASLNLRVRLAAAFAAAAVLLGLGVSGCSKRPAPVKPPTPKAAAALPVDARRLSDADDDASNWLSHGRTYSEQRFSPLESISIATVGSLKLAWFVDLGADERGEASTPLIVDGVLYLTTSWSRVRALDASTGKEMWRFDPQLPGEWGVNACCDVVNRGVAAWKDKVILAALDGRLIGLDRLSGKKLWETVVIDRAERASLTGAPRVIKGRVFIGSSGGEFGVRGRVTAVNADTGAILWRTFTVPGDPSLPPENPFLIPARSTWNGQWWTQGGGATVWDAMAYDPALDLLYIGTGNGSPWPQSQRSPRGGDNLYVSSIIALRGETGEYVWHYQTTPGDEWGYDAASQLILAELFIAGSLRSVVMQASANGFFYTLDRLTGELLSATAYVPTTWATGVDLQTGRPNEARAARYSRTRKPFLARPGPQGAHSWHPMAFNPRTGVVFIPAMVNAAELSVCRNCTSSRYALNTGTNVTRPVDLAPDTSQLIAWDPAAGRALWHLDSASPVASGVLATAGGLVFQGSTEGILRALDAGSGKALWQADTGASISTAPVSYAVGDAQYIAIAAGAGGAAPLAGGAQMRDHTPRSNRARLLVYSLSGKAQLPAVQAQPSAHSAAQPFGTAAQVKRGEALYERFCARCHGARVINTGPLKGLSESSRLGDAKQWNLVVFAGLLGTKGMPGFMAEMTAADAEALRTYVTSATVK